MSKTNRQVLTADGPTKPVRFTGPVRLKLSGNFGGGTAQLEEEDLQSGVFSAIIGGSFTAATDTLFDFPRGSANVLQVSMTGSITPATVVKIQPGS